MMYHSGAKHPNGVDYPACLYSECDGRIFGKTTKDKSIITCSYCLRTAAYIGAKA